MYLIKDTERVTWVSLFIHVAIYPPLSLADECLGLIELDQNLIVKT